MELNYSFEVYFFSIKVVCKKKKIFFLAFLFHLSTSFIIFVLHKLKENATISDIFGY